MTTENQPLDNEPQDNTQADEFDSAFDEYAGKTTPSDERDAYHRDEHQDHDGEPADEAEQAPDVSERLSALEQENQKLKHSEASQRGRVGAYQRQLNESQQTINQLQQQLQQFQQQNQHANGQAKTTDERKDEAAQTMGSDDWETFKQDFPDMARAVEARLTADQQRQAQLEQQIAQLQSTVQPIQQQAHEQAIQSEYARLEDRHSDWRDVIRAPAFKTWLQNQNPAIKALAASDSADDASALIDFYKGMTPGDNSRAETHDKRKDRLASAQTVSRRGAAQQRGTPEDFDAAFEHYAAKRTRQR
jgi:DNA repair exonuclease SbcCD ATPase subunit